MYIGILLIVLAAFAFASAGLYYVAAILVLCGKLLGTLIIGIVGGCRLFAKGIWLALVALWQCGAVLGAWGFIIGCAAMHWLMKRVDPTCTIAYSGCVHGVEWLKRTYVKREKRGRGL
ncbi:gp70 [Burkholderia phage Bcep1]|uniref:Gp70 n=1 Tax=Burkholderia phage Bcep1 TaxID=2883943 RepID=Q6UIW2_9CAUD|nr:membrane protein [Burkholderia phage Bcep1]AAQ73416.1 gp70 [Burkholderia phage Bcep1]